MPTTAKISPDHNIVEIYGKYEQGDSVQDLAKEYGIHRTAIYAGFRALGFKIGLPQSDNRRKLSLEDEEHLCDLYEQGATIQQLREEFSLSLQGVNKILIRNGIKKRKNGPSGMQKNTRGRFVR